MPFRPPPNPTPKTAAARAALASFFCDLCQKGYSRHNEYEAHLSSYDHSHKQRLKDMRQLSRDPLAGEKARRAERQANEGAGLISIKLGGGAAGAGDGSGSAAGGSRGGGSGDANKAKTGPGGTSGFKKGGFKKAGFKNAFTPVGVDEDEERDAQRREEEKTKVVLSVPGVQGDRLVESDTEDEGYEVYDPRKPTEY